MKLFLKLKCSPDEGSLISEVKLWLEDQPGVFYKNLLQDCSKQWEKCVTLGGAYAEKDYNCAIFRCSTAMISRSGTLLIERPRIASPKCSVPL